MPFRLTKDFIQTPYFGGNLYSVPEETITIKEKRETSWNNWNGCMEIISTLANNRKNLVRFLTFQCY